jgi:hypothetical protein
MLAHAPGIKSTFGPAIAAAGADPLFLMRALADQPDKEATNMAEVIILIIIINMLMPVLQIVLHI